MATKSIFKSINVRSVPQAKKLIVAMERARGKEAEPVIFQREVTSVNKSDIKELFEGVI